jgi:DNA-binding NtrC family response regulator
MPTRVVVVHDDAAFLGDLVNTLTRAGYEVAGFLETRAALAAIEADEQIEMLITRVAFPAGMPHGVSLAQMARLKHRIMKILFIARPEMVEYAEGIGEVLVMPVPPADVVAKAREMLPLPN